ncbi:MAG TPA: DUF1080 domain-containing protein [Armatimonadota bacterium]|nr:DUF1080 domain-containing protein [Armatimonadota bacterium]
MANLGYDDTPVIPGSVYKVHDGTRPQPRVVTPGAACAGAPSDAVVLFDGTGLAGWVSVSDGAPARWKVEDGYLEVVPSTGDIQTTALLGDCQLHLEMATPAVVKGESQGRGNSGIFLMGRYEIQVLDCYQNPTYPDGTIGAIYGQYPPLVNACRQPGEWQTYDIIWEAPQFAGEALVKPARVTVLLNTIVIHHAQELQGPTQHRQLASYAPHDDALPLRLQDHGDLVRFRNIWYRPLTGYDQG